MHLNVQPLSNFNEFLLVNFLFKVGPGRPRSTKSLHFQKPIPGLNIESVFLKELLSNLHLTLIQVWFGTFSSFFILIKSGQKIFFRRRREALLVDTALSFYLSLSSLIYYFLIYINKIHFKTIFKIFKVSSYRRFSDFFHGWRSPEAYESIYSKKLLLEIS